MSVLFPLLLLLGSVIAVYRSSRERRIRYVLLLALSVRLFFSALNVIGMTFPFSDTTDVGAFLDYARSISGGDVEFDVSQSYVWASIMGLINLYTGDILYSPLIINSVAGTYAVLFAYRISIALCGDMSRAFAVAVIVALMPPLVFASATHLREATSTLFFTMFVHYLLQCGLEKDVRWRTLAMAFLSSALAALMHGAFVLLPVFVLGYMLLKLLNNNPSPGVIVSYVLLIGTLLGLAYLFSSLQIGASKAGLLYSSSFDAIYEGILKVIARGMMLEQMDVLSQSTFLFFLLAMLKFLFSPFFAGELRAFDLVRWPLVLYLFVCFLRILGSILPYPFTRLRISFLVLSALIILYCFLFAIGSRDPDTAFRHYLKMLPVIIAAGAPLSFLFHRVHQREIILNN